jgi:hypothetical protein
MSTLTSHTLRTAAVGAAALLALSIAAALPGPASAERGRAPRAEAAGERLGSTIEGAIRSEGPFFTAEERAVIERACGYAPGSWDGFEATLRDDAFVCRDGRQVDGPEVRAVLAAARPRIDARIERVMASAEVRGAIEQVSAEATAEALASVDRQAIARAVRTAQAAGGGARVDEGAIARALEAAEEGRRDALEQARRVIEESRRARGAAKP